jgi:hypothetical protein
VTEGSGSRRPKNIRIRIRSTDCYLGLHLLVLPDLAGLLFLEDVERIEDPLVVGLEESANLGRVQGVVPDVRGHARPLLLPVHLQKNIYLISGI